MNTLKSLVAIALLGLSPVAFAQTAPATPPGEKKEEDNERR